jgi:N-acetyl-anhydromuramyl-L-alanine amidase AmpD
MIKGNGGPIAKHGPATEAATKLWLQAQVPRPTHLAAATAPRPVVAPSGGMYDLTSLVLKQARQYREGRVAAVRQVTIHTAEIGETPNGAEALASVASTSERRASWNYAVDCDSVTFSVRAGDTAYAAGPGNDSGVHIELAGRASQDASGWSDDYSRAELALAARLVAALLHEHQLPAVKLDPFDLLPDAMKPGVCGHYAWSAASVEARRRGLKNPPWWSRSKSAWRSTDHVDPGTHFPWPSLMATVRDLRGS